MINLTEELLERYSRNILLKEIGIEGQLKLMNSKILVIGAGGLGSPISLYLAAAGIGTIGIVDYDRVDISNLQRQIIHFTEDIGKYKVESALEKIKRINPEVNVIIYNVKINDKNISEIIKPFDFIIDGTDNFSAKFLINDACFFEKKPFSHGGILRFTGQTMTIIPGKSACYRCVFNAPPPIGAVPTCSQAGILGSIAGILGTIQATESIKFVLNIGELLINQLLMFDALTMEFRKKSLYKRDSCPLCGKNPIISKIIMSEETQCSLQERK
ncbi:MAG: HesA/MoeB/ThiF family protein [Chitinispirillaceae bacterium]|nr:HesA/MoeB/ThiF family protein [Chitinispirillaceae bacterium]